MTQDKNRAPDRPCGTCERVRSYLPNWAADRLRRLERRPERPTETKPVRELETK